MDEQMERMVNDHGLFMRIKLEENAPKKGDSWKFIEEAWLLKRLDEEVKEFKETLKTGHLSNIRREGADVSNIIMFIAENRQTKWAEESARKVFGK